MLEHYLCIIQSVDMVRVINVLFLFPFLPFRSPWDGSRLRRRSLGFVVQWLWLALRWWWKMKLEQTACSLWRDDPQHQPVPLLLLMLSQVRYFQLLFTYCPASHVCHTTNVGDSWLYSWTRESLCPNNSSVKYVKIIWWD